MKNIRLTVWIGMMCGCLAAGMLQAGTRPDNACPAEEDGSRLWLPVMRPAEGAEVEVIYKGKVSPTIAIAIAELKNAWKGEPVLLEKKRTGQGDGFAITSSEHQVRILSSTEAGLLYGVYCLLRMQAAGQVTVPLSVTEQPVYDLRILNHWDNPDGTVERGYAGRSLWNWEELPGTLSPRYEAYARANASVGINGTVLNNVNASPQVLATSSLEKVKALADVFRPYGIKVYLSVNFASPIQLGKLDTADPLDKEVIRWWRRKVKEIYTLIPDFGGFLVKANSCLLYTSPSPRDCS